MVDSSLGETPEEARIVFHIRAQRIEADFIVATLALDLWVKPRKCKSLDMHGWLVQAFASSISALYVGLVLHVTLVCLLLVQKSALSKRQAS